MILPLNIMIKLAPPMVKNSIWLAYTNFHQTISEGTENGKFIPPLPWLENGSALLPQRWDVTSALKPGQDVAKEMLSHF